MGLEISKKHAFDRIKKAVLENACSGGIKNHDIRQPTELEKRHPFQPVYEDTDSSVSSFECWALPAELLRSDQNLAFSAKYLRAAGESAESFKMLRS